MNIRQIFYSIVRKWWLIVLLMAAGGGMGFLNSYFTKPLYHSDTKLYIINHVTGGQLFHSSDIDLSQQLVRQYSDIIFSRKVIAVVASDLNHYHLTTDKILSMIKININKDSNILTISAISTDPEVAAAVANATGREFINQIRELTNTDNVGILDYALVPNYSDSKNKVEKVLIGLLLALIVAFSIIYFIEYFDTTVHSVEDIEKGLKLRVIGIIPEHDISY